MYMYRHSTGRKCMKGSREGEGEKGRGERGERKREGRKERERERESMNIQCHILER